MKRLLSFLLCAALLLTPALGASYPDLPEDHWAYPAMDRAVRLGLLTGHPDGTMDPSGVLTWGQYLTILARAFYPETGLAAPEGAHWAEGARLAALEAGVLRADLPPQIGPADLDQPVSRQAAAVPLARLLDPAEGDAPSDFSDWEDLDPDCRPAVLSLWRLGLLRGMPDGAFHGEDCLDRAAGCTLLLRVLDLPAPPPPQDPPLPEEPPVPDPEAPLTQEEALELVTQGQMSWEEYERQPFWLTVLGENRQKCRFLFGDENKRRFASQEEADAGVTEITVPVWRLDPDTGVKTEDQAVLTVHTALAQEVTEIFTEIFRDPEQFPIKNLGGYQWRGAQYTGEHNCGTAIDINWEENYQVYPDGRIGAGSYWKPGEDPFSIPADGSVVRIFAAHGFAWGGNAWPTNQDYMHFSYLGK